MCRAQGAVGGVLGPSLPSLGWLGMGTHLPHDGLRWDETIHVVMGCTPRDCLLPAVTVALQEEIPESGLSPRHPR